MDYTIQQILPSQIVVQFEDGNRTVVAISSTATPEEVDHFVSFHDPDFYPDPETLVNYNITVGETRTSSRINEENPPSNVEEIPSPRTISPLEDAYLIFGAQYLAAQGDSSVLDQILEDLGEFSSSDLISRLNKIRENNEEVEAAAEEILQIALDELA